MVSQIRVLLKLVSVQLCTNVCVREGDYGNVCADRWWEALLLTLHGDFAARTQSDSECSTYGSTWGANMMNTHLITYIRSANHPNRLTAP